MQTTGSNACTGLAGIRPARFKRIAARGFGGARLMHACPVMSAGGRELGKVEYLMVDAMTQQLRYVMLQDPAGGATIAIPWQSLYFDAALGRLVFYTLD